MYNLTQIMYNLIQIIRNLENNSGLYNVLYPYHIKSQTLTNRNNHG